MRASCSSRQRPTLYSIKYCMSCAQQKTTSRRWRRGMPRVRDRNSRLTHMTSTAGRRARSRTAPRTRHKQKKGESVVRFNSRIRLRSPSTTCTSNGLSTTRFDGGTRTNLPERKQKRMSKQSTHARHSVNTTIPSKWWKCDDEPGCEANTSKAKKTGKKTATLPKNRGLRMPCCLLAGCCTPTLPLLTTEKNHASTTSDYPRMKLCFHPTGYCQKRKKKKVRHVSCE